MKNELIRPNVVKINPYIPGKPIEEIKRRFGLKKVIKLASNENPLGPSLKVRRALGAALKNLNRYPDGSCFYLRQKLAAKIGFSGENLIFGNGSDELIDVIIKTFVNDDEEILTSARTFLEYEIIAAVNSRRVRTVPLKGFSYDLASMLDAVTAKTKLIFIANPNNPTGTYLSKAEIDGFLSRLPDNVIVVFDEAYNQFVRASDFPDTFKYLTKRNVIILHTFSKIYALAGLRLGYAVADAELVSFMERVRQPFNVNSLAQEGAIAALDDERYLRKTVDLISKEKGRLYSALDKMGVEYVRSETNFILIDVRSDCFSVFEEMLKEGVIVRDMRQYGLNTHIRVTIGTPEENKLFLHVLAGVLSKRVHHFKYDKTLSQGAE